MEVSSITQTAGFRAPVSYILEALTNDKQVSRQGHRLGASTTTGGLESASFTLSTRCCLPEPHTKSYVLTAVWMLAPRDLLFVCCASR